METKTRKTDIPEKEQRLLRHCQTMSVLASCIEIENQNDLIDHKFKVPHLNNHIRRIKESLKEIKLNLAFKYRVKDRELMEYDHATQIHRLFKYFSTMETSQLTEIMDAYEEYDKINPPL